MLASGFSLDASKASVENMEFEIGSTVLYECSGGMIEGITLNTGGTAQTVKE